MARTRPPDRFQQLLDAALRVFAAKGVRRARMADIAREMGVAPGSLYNWVESKEALFHWIVEHGADAGPISTPKDLPIRAPSEAKARRRLRERLDEEFHMPLFEAACARARPKDARAELEGLLRELYDRIARARRPMSVVERSALDVPELFELYFARLRRDYFARFARYVERRQREAAFRADVDPRTAGRFAIEAIVYFARHRFGDPDPGALELEEGAVRDDVVRLTAGALVADPPRSPRRRSR